MRPRHSSYSGTPAPAFGLTGVFFSGSTGGGGTTGASRTTSPAISMSSSCSRNQSA
ncbi:MAG: hypothetical protein MUE42_05250 [Opitutaceae bacterium]|nr:hypothetical protein [Opitutaceae bacterium]